MEMRVAEREVVNIEAVNTVIGKTEVVSIEAVWCIEAVRKECANTEGLVKLIVYWSWRRLKFAEHLLSQCCVLVLRAVEVLSADCYCCCCCSHSSQFDLICFDYSKIYQSDFDIALGDAQIARFLAILLCSNECLLDSLRTPQLVRVQIALVKTDLFEV